MIYELYEAHRALVRPYAKGAAALHRAVAKRVSPSHQGPVGRTIMANLECFERTFREYERPSFGISSVETNEGRVPVHEEITRTLPFCDLVHFRRENVTRDAPRVLIVAPLAGHYATLVRDTVEALVPDHDVFITDWKNARDVPLSRGSFGFEDHVRYVITFLETLGPRAHLIAVCQPCVPALAAVAVMAMDQHKARPRSLTLMAGPVDPRVHPTTTSAFVATQGLAWFRENVLDKVPNRYQGKGRLVYSGFRQLSVFASWRATDHIYRQMRFYGDLITGNEARAEEFREFYDRYLAVMDIPAEFYLDTLERVFLEAQLATGRLKHEGRVVKLQAITDTALLTVEGGQDDATPVGQTSAAQRLCVGIPRTHKAVIVESEVGHYGVFSGSRFRSRIAPRMGEFIRAHHEIR